MVNNALIIVTEDLEKFIGGKLSFRGDKLSEVKNYSIKFYIDGEDGQSGILIYDLITEGADIGEMISEDLGEISSENLFYSEDLNLIKMHSIFL